MAKKTKGSNTADVLVGTTGDDIIQAGGGNDTVSGGDGNDTVSGDNGNDTLYGGTGNDTLDGGADNDFLDGGTGNDDVSGGAGDDVANYVFSENLTSTDVYDGGRGYDVLQLTLTYGEMASSAVQADLAAFSAFLAANSNTQSDKGPVFHFTAFNLSVADFESYRVVLTNAAPTAHADSGATTEDGIVTGNVLTNDSDSDHLDRLSVASYQATSALGAHISVAADGSYSYDPLSVLQHLAQGAVVTDTFSYVVADLAGATSSTTVTITVTGLNDAPVAVADVAAGTENQALLIDVLANDTDVDDGHSFTLVSVDGVTGGGTAAIQGNQLAFNPGSTFDHLAEGQTAPVIVAYTMADEHGATSTATVAITVTGTNDTPVAVADTAAGTENQSLLIDVLANDTDVDDGHSLSLVSVDSVTGGGTASVQGGQVAFNPGAAFDHLAAGATASVTVAYTVADEYGATSTANVAITVTGTNDGPVAVADTAAGTENESLLIDVLANDTDVDDGHSFTLVSVDGVTGGGTAAIQGNQLAFNPGSTFDHLAAGATASVTVAYTMEDEHGATSTANVAITVTGTNDGPVAVADTAAGTENESLLLDVLANDIDGDDGHSFTLVSVDSVTGGGAASIQDNKLAFNPGSTFDHLALGATASVTVAYTMADEHGVTSTATVAITVTGTNDGPVAVENNNDTPENQALLYDVLSNDTDVDDGHSFTLVSADVVTGGGTASVLDGRVAFDPGTDFDHLAEGDTASVTVAYTMADEHGATSTANYEITVVGTNDGPVAVADTAAGTENESLLIDVLANDTDVDDTHSFTLVSVDGVTGGGTASVQDGQLAFTPGAAFDHLNLGDTASVTVTYTMADEHGATSTANVAITITGTNDGPVAVADTASGTENQVLLIDVLANDTDVDDGHSFTLVGVSGITGGGAASVQGNQLAFNPGTAFDHLAEGQTASVTVSYTMADEHGATSTANVAITVTGTNDAPVAVADTASGTENQSLLIDILANDTDVDDGHSLTLVSVDGVTGGGAAAIQDNKLAFTPGAAFDHLADGVTASVAVAYTMADEHGATSTATVAITVTGTNDAPVAVADAASGTESQSLVIDVLANDTDADDGHNLTLVSVDGVTGGGSASVQSGQVAFNPGTDFEHLAEGATASVTVAYTVADEHGATSTANVAITVTGTNDAPVAVADASAGTENQSLLIDVLANDTDGDDGHSFTLVSVDSVTGGGTASVHSNQLAFNPGTTFDHLAEGQTASVTVAYTMADEHGATSTANVAITVTGTNDGPLAVADTAAGTENESLLIDVLANDTDVDDGHSFTLVGVNGVTGGGDASVDNGQIAFNPGTAFDYLAEGQTASVTVSYTMADEYGATSTANVAITVTGTNDGPVAVDDSFAAAGGLGGQQTLDFDAGDYGNLNSNYQGYQFEGFNYTGYWGQDYTNSAYTQAYYNSLDGADGAIRRADGGDFGVESFQAGGINTDYYTSGPYDVTVRGYSDGNEVASQTFSITSLQLNDHHMPTISLGAGFSAVDEVRFFLPYYETIGGTYYSEDYLLLDNLKVANQVAGEDITHTINVLGNDTGGHEGATLSVLSADATSAHGAAVTVNPDGTIHYDPTQAAAIQALDDGETLTDTFAYTITDELGATSSATVTVTVSGGNDGPVAVADTNFAVENGAAATGNVLANDSDVDVEPLSVTNPGTYGLGAGTLTINGDGSYSFTVTDESLAEGEQATNLFDYGVSDGTTSATAKLWITATGVNDAPIAQNDSLTGVPDGFVENPANGHFYAWVTAPLSFQDAMTNAHNMGGYLATITSAQENNFAHSVMGYGADWSWIGASDAASEGDWRWVDGPEAGQQFWIGGPYGSSLAYANWSPGAEPNNSGNEDYAHMWGGGTWNDLGDTNLYSLVEIGGRPGDVKHGFVSEDAPRTFSESRLLANDSDVDQGHVLHVVSVSGTSALGATVTLADGQITYVPTAASQSLNEGEIVVDTFTYVVTDEHGATSTATASIEVGGVNDGPVAVADTASGTENQSLLVDVLANDTDVDDGHSFTLVSVDGVTGGGSASVQGNQLAFNPGAAFDHLAQGQTASVSVAYTMADEHGATATANVAITVTGTNDAPVAVADTFTAAVNGALTIAASALTANDTDADDGDTKSVVSVSNAINGTVSISNGEVTFTPTSGFTGAAFFTYAMQDSTGATSTATASVNVVPANQAPDITYTYAVAASSLFNGSFEIGPGQNAFFGGSTAIPGWTVTGHSIDYLNTVWRAADGAYSIDLNGFQAGGIQQTFATTPGTSYTVTFQIGSDGEGVPPGTTRFMQVMAGDSFAQYASVTTGHTHANMGWTPQTFTFMANSSWTTLSFQALNPGAAGVTLDDVRLVTNDINLTTDEDTSVTVAGFSVSDSDAGGDPLLVTLTAGHGNVQLALDYGVQYVDGDGADGTISFTANQYVLNAALAGGIIYNPNADYNGVDTITAVVNDQGNTGAGGPLSDAATVDITVLPVADAPVAHADTAAITEDGPGILINVLANDTDADDGAVLHVVNAYVVAGGGTASIQGDQIYYDPGASFQYLANGQTASVTVSYTIIDDTNEISESTVAITVTGTNHAPNASVDSFILSNGVHTESRTLGFENAALVGDWTSNPDGVYGKTYDGYMLGGTVVWQLPALNGFASTAYVPTGGYPGFPNYNLPVFARADGGDFSFTSFKAGQFDTNYGATGYPVVITGYRDGAVVATQTFNPSYVGTSFNNNPQTVVTLGSGFGSVDQVTFTSSVPTVNNGLLFDSFVVSAQVGTLRSQENVTTDFAVLSNDYDPDPGDTVSVQSVAAASALGAVLSVNPNGTIHYDSTHAAGADALAAGETGYDIFNYVVSDGQGGTSSTSVTVMLTGENDAPTAHDDTGTATIGAPATTIAVLANDTDPDPDHLDTKTLVSVSGGMAGSTVAMNAGAITYGIAGVLPELAAGQTVTDTLSYVMRDGHGVTSSATVTVTVVGANDAPVVQGETLITDTDAPLNVASALLLANDTDIDTGDTLSVASVGNATHGTVALSNGTVTFTPDAGYSGTASFNYVVQDSANGTATASVLVRVGIPNEAPTIAFAPSTLVNGSFEQGPGPNSFLGGSTALPGWTVTGHSVDYLSTVWQNADGAYSLDLNGWDAGGVQQTFATTAGVTYAVTFQMAVNTHTPDLRTLQVSAAGTTAQYTADPTGHTVADMGWTQRTFTFTATGPQTTLGFQSLNGGTDGPTLDDVRLTAVNVRVEEELPTTLTGLHVADADAYQNPVLVSLAAGHGEVSLASAAGVSLVDADGSDGTISFTGSVSAVNAALASGVVYTGSEEFVGSDTLTATVNDQGNTGSGGAKTATATVAVDVTAGVAVHSLVDESIQGSAGADYAIGGHEFIDPYGQFSYARGGDSGGQGGSATADSGYRSLFGSAVGDTLGVYATANAGNGGASGNGYGGYFTNYSTYSPSGFPYSYTENHGFFATLQYSFYTINRNEGWYIAGPYNAGQGGNGGNGGDATAHVSGNLIDARSGDDQISLIATAQAGSGGGGSDGGTGGSVGGIVNEQSVSYNWYYYGNGNYTYADWIKSTYYTTNGSMFNGRGGVGGWGGYAGSGGHADSDVSGNTVSGGRGDDTILLSASAQGGHGGIGGNGGYAGSGSAFELFTAGGGNGGSGGYAHATLDGNVVDGGQGNDTIQLSGEAHGGHGFQGGWGGSAGYTTYSDAYYTYAAGRFSSMPWIDLGHTINKYYYWGTGGTGGNGGNGGDAVVQITDNTVHGGDGNDALSISAIAVGGSAGGAGGGGYGGWEGSYYTENPQFYSYYYYLQAPNESYGFNSPPEGQGNGHWYSYSNYTYVTEYAGWTGASGAAGAHGVFDVDITGNTLDGGNGDDTFAFSVEVTGPGFLTLADNAVIGGAGTDTFDVSGYARAMEIDLGLGTFSDGSGTNSMSGIENLIGTAFGDTLTGDAGANVISANDGNDIVNGGAGDDIITGGSGNDVVTGGAGDDQLTGGDGNDTFVFADGDGQDQVSDFSGSDGGQGDVIDLSDVAGLDTFADLQAHMTQVGADTVIALNGADKMTLVGIDHTTLRSDDFVI